MKKGNWTIIFEDKKVIKNNGAESGTGYYVMMILFGMILNFLIFGQFNTQLTMTQIR